MRVIYDAGIPAQVLYTCEAAAAGRVSKCLTIDQHRTCNSNKIIDSDMRVSISKEI